MFKNVLIVDDSPVMRKVVIRMLKESGFAITGIEASNGKEALKSFSLLGTHLVLCDWSMPIMDGLELVKALRAMDPERQVPIVMCTAEAHEDKIILALNAGSDDYMVKPLVPEVVKRKLARYLAS